MKAWAVPGRTQSLGILGGTEVQDRVHRKERRLKSGEEALIEPASNLPCSACKMSHTEKEREQKETALLAMVGSESEARINSVCVSATMDLGIFKGFFKNK